MSDEEKGEVRETIQHPPVGFYFIIQQALEEGIPVYYFGLQEGMTERSVSIRAEVMDIQLDVPTIVSVQKLLSKEWDKSYKGAESGDYLEWGTTANPKVIEKPGFSGEMV